jgi:hypothetical protein
MIISAFLNVLCLYICFSEWQHLSFSPRYIPNIPCTVFGILKTRIHVITTIIINTDDFLFKCLLPNTVLVIVFLQRKYRSPVTIFLAVLAITDCLTAVFASIPNVVGYYFNYAELERTPDSYWKGWSWGRKSCYNNNNN